MQKINIFHRTLYRISKPAQLKPHKLYLRPRGGHDVRISRSLLSIKPHAELNWFGDELGNSIARPELVSNGHISRITAIGNHHPTASSRVLAWIKYIPTPPTKTSNQACISWGTRPHKYPATYRAGILKLLTRAITR